MTLFPKFKKTRDGVNVICEQRLLQQVNNLVLNTEVCTGCGICVEACPEEAIASGSWAPHGGEPSGMPPLSTSMKSSAPTAASALSCARSTP